MRMSLIFAMLVSALPSVLLAQASPATNAPPSDATLRDQLPVVIDSNRVIELEERDVAIRQRARVGGAVARATRAGQPWQAINPFAPPEFGQWYENVSVDPHTHQPAGIVLVSVRIGSLPREHR